MHWLAQMLTSDWSIESKKLVAPWRMWNYSSWPKSAFATSQAANCGYLVFR